jgi:succinyl-CoA synthetase alpha subunit
MTILVNSETRLLVQGITGRQATWSVRDIIQSGTHVVAGVVPGKGGTTYLGVPVFDFVEDAVRATRANASLAYVPAAVAREAILEACEAGISLVVYPGDGFPVHDAIRLRRTLRGSGNTLVGPNTAGLIAPGVAKLGFMPSDCFMPGRLGVISKSGSLSYETCSRLSAAGIGQSTMIGVGGDPIKGVTIGEALALFHADGATDAVLVLGEIGGIEEYEILDYLETPSAKPVVVFLVGRTAPSGQKLGHAGALIGSARETYQAKADALEACGVTVVPSLSNVVPAVAHVLTSRSTARRN